MTLYNVIRVGIEKMFSQFNYIMFFIIKVLPTKILEMSQNTRRIKE